MHYVYILISKSDPSKIYIGITKDINQRLDEHNQKQSAYSKRYAPWKLETFISFQDKKLANAFERYLKSGSGFSFLKRHLLPKAVTESG
jgi:putative endonuclease